MAGKPNLANMAAQRAVLIDAALAVVAKHDFDGFLTRVVKAADVGMQTIYRHFANTEELWNAAVASRLARDVAAIQQAAEAERYPLNALARAIAVFYGSIDSVRLARHLDDNPAYRKAIRKALEPLLAAAGHTPRASEQHAAAILGGLYGLADIEATNRTAVMFALRAIGLTQHMAEKLV